MLDVFNGKVFGIDIWLISIIYVVFVVAYYVGKYNRWFWNILDRIFDVDIVDITTIVGVVHIVVFSLCWIYMIQYTFSVYGVTWYISVVVVIFSCIPIVLFYGDLVSSVLNFVKKSARKNANGVI